MMKSIARVLLLVCAPVMLLGIGCATNRGIVDVRISEPQNPASGPAVTFVRVTDKRVFEKAPRVASAPSLQGGEIGDKAITSRAIARKRGGTGLAMGDILLPEGRTVENVVREALTKSFRDAGYRVIDGAPGANDNVVPIEADIEQFWSWDIPGFWVFAMEFEARVSIKGDIPPFKNGEAVRGYVRLHTQSPGTRAWVITINKGMDAFIAEVKKRLAKE
jgi:hypothetical protein